MKSCDYRDVGTLPIMPEDHDQHLTDPVREENESERVGETTLRDIERDSPYDELVSKLLEEPIDVPILADAVEQQEAADAADTLEDLEGEQAANVLVEMEDQAAADALAEMEKPLAVRVIEDLVDEENTSYAVRLLELMATDDAVDVLQAMRDVYRESVLSGMPLARASKLRRLIGYDEESAGGLMTTDFISVREEMTVSEAVKVVRQREIPDELQHLPVISEQDRFVGIIGLRDLLVHKAHESIQSFLDRNVDTIRPDMDREAVAQQFDRYDYAMMPVVDTAGRLLGIVTFDDVIDIIRREQTEDVQKTVGAGAGEAVYSSLGEKFRGRFPWLGASLIMTCLAAGVVLLYEELIAEKPILAFLMPVIAALVGNAGHQALAVTLRGIVLDEVRRERVWPLVLREGAIGVLNGFVLGTLLFLGVWALGESVSSANWRIGLVAGIAATFAMGIGTIAGSAIPLIMRRLGVDPAQSSAIFLIMVTDAMSFSALLILTVIIADIT